MTFTVLTYNNFVGIVTDAYLIKNIIHNNISQNVDVKFIDQLHNNDVADVGIWIQNFNIAQLNRFKKNIFFINEEWSGNHELNNLHLFDYVVCKTNYAKSLLQKYKDVICLPFISRNYYLDINLGRYIGAGDFILAIQLVFLLKKTLQKRLVSIIQNTNIQLTMIIFIE